jgi:hypothetical protein
MIFVFLIQRNFSFFRLHDCPRSLTVAVPVYPETHTQATSAANFKEILTSGFLLGQDFASSIWTALSF